jgi:hypothetical protein
VVLGATHGVMGLKEVLIDLLSLFNKRPSCINLASVNLKSAD